MSDWEAWTMFGVIVIVFVFTFVVWPILSWLRQIGSDLNDVKRKIASRESQKVEFKYWIPPTHSNCRCELKPAVNSTAFSDWGPEPAKPRESKYKKLIEQETSVRVQACNKLTREFLVPREKISYMTVSSSVSENCSAAIVLSKESPLADAIWAGVREWGNFGWLSIETIPFRIVSILPGRSGWLVRANSEWLFTLSEQYQNSKLGRFYNG